MLAPGKYRGRPVAAALGLASTGTEQIAVQFDLVDPPGERITWYGYFTDATTERTIESLRHCGWRDPNNDLSVFVAGEPLPVGFDQEVELVVQQEAYNGKTQTKVAFVNGGGGLALKNALDKGQAQSFAERMKRQIDALDRAAGRPSGGSAAPRQAPRTTGARQTQAAPPPQDGPPDELIDQQADSVSTRGDVPF
jgi:hypothetical protein